MEENAKYIPPYTSTHKHTQPEANLVEDKVGESHQADTQLIRERKDKFIKFLKTRYNVIAYALLAVIVGIAVRIRTRNLPRLRDVTTNTWTLGPDLDPFLFLRWSKYIVENGKLFLIDTMRYSPLGYDTKGELLFHPYLMAWFHKAAVLFGSESVTHSAVLYPVFMFALTVIAFFLFARVIFADPLGPRKANVIALVSSFFFVVVPIFLPRTIAGIPEKESAAFLFMFLAFYFFILAWKAKKLKAQSIFALLAGASTAGMALIWGGYNYIFIILSSSVFVAFMLGKVDSKKVSIYTIWFITALVFMIPSSTKYTFGNLLARDAAITLYILLAHFIIFKTKIKTFIPKKLSKLPPETITLLISIVLMFLAAMLIFGPSYILARVNNIIAGLVTPSTSRLIQTVAENRQPFFVDWSGSFGPFVKNMPLFLWLFFLGSIRLFYEMTKFLRKRERVVLTMSYIIFILSITLTRYSSSSTFNGTNTTSSIVYVLGFIVMLSGIGYYYHRYNKQSELQKFRKVNYSYLLLILLFFLSLLSARGAIRLIMMLVPPASIIVGYFVVTSVSDAKKMKGDLSKILTWILVAILILATVFSAFQFYQTINGQATNYAPSIYTNQWQLAMSWVRDNTPEDSVFGHWWDYGYWLQSIGERATVLDGGNAISYWNHMMGRYALTGQDNRQALEFLYAHETTHFLIDSTDLGKYTAFSSIGSNSDFDRRSWITSFQRDNNQIQETKNATMNLYTGGAPLDEDILFEEGETKVFLPGDKTGIGAIITEREASGNLVKPVEGIFVYQGQQHRLPLRYAFVNGEFLDFGTGVEAGIFLIPRITQDGNQASIESDGALLYLSRRTVKSQLARLYLYKEDNPNFKLIHSEDDFFVGQFKTEHPTLGDIVYFNGIKGPIRIWEINYPEDIQSSDEYLNTAYPTELESA